ncbi:MAG: hypothetical protein NT150_09250 [Bacteroidetes bacterium]|nr:hypothetical protein [Bacteroidota bacterium]
MKFLFIAAAVLCFGLVRGSAIYSIQSGNWNDTTTWNTGTIPKNGDSTIVYPNHEITMNKDSAQIFYLEVYGALKWTTTKSTTAKHLLLHNNAALFSTFFIGTLNIDSALTINDGTTTIANLHLYSKNNCNIKGELIFISESGTKQFKNISIYPFGKWNNNTNSDPVILGNIKNDGTFKACAGSGCTYHFQGSNSFSGDSLISFPRVQSSGDLVNKGFLGITHSLNGNPNLINEGTLQLYLSPLTFHVNNFNTSAPENTVIYKDTAEQNIFQPNNGYYENIILEYGVKRIINPLIVDQSLRIKTGCLLKCDTFKISTNNSASLQLDSLATLWIGNNDNLISPGFPKGFSKVNLHVNSMVRYMAMGNENIESTVIYGNLNLDDGNLSQSIKTISNDQLNVKGNLTLEESSVLLQCKHCLLNIDGDWEGIGNLKMEDGLFYFKGNGNNNGLLYPGKSTVIYNGNGDQIVKVGTYYNLNINKNSGKAIVKGNDHILEIQKTFRIQKGAFEIGNESVLIKDSIIVEDALTFTSTKQSKTFKHFVITNSGKVNMKSAASINIVGNWSNFGSFIAGKGEVIFSDSTQSQTITGNTTFYDLSLQKKNTNVVFNSSVNINHLLKIYSGKINIGDQNIQLTSSARITGENNKNYIFGKSGKIQITKNIMAGTRDSVGDLGLVFDAITNLGSTTISRTHQTIIINGLSSIKRVYTIVPAINNNLNVNVLFHFLPNEMHGTQKSKLELWKSEDGLSNWQKMTGTLDTLNNGITINNISSFSTWSFTEDEAPLPLKWLDFKVLQNNNYLDILWQTASEKNTNSFVVERSEDGKTFQDVAAVNACGNCEYINHYNYKILTPETITYFRIKSIDYNSFADYSVIRVFAPEKSADAKRTYFDCTGKEMVETNKNELPNGIYFYRTNNNETGKIVIQN